MSRIGRMPITVPAGVTVNVADGNVVTVKGPKGELTKALRPEMIIKQEGSTITVDRPSDDKLHRSLHGLTRTLLHNMIVGVTDGYIPCGQGGKEPGHEPGLLPSGDRF